MSDTYDPPRVLGCTELAHWFGLQPRSVYIMRDRGTVPEPDQLIGGRTPVWYRETLRQWGKATGRLDRSGALVPVPRGRKAHV